MQLLGNTLPAMRADHQNAGNNIKSCIWMYWLFITRGSGINLECSPYLKSLNRCLVSSLINIGSWFGSATWNPIPHNVCRYMYLNYYKVIVVMSYLYSYKRHLITKDNRPYFYYFLVPKDSIQLFSIHVVGDFDHCLYYSLF